VEVTFEVATVEHRFDFVHRRLPHAIEAFIEDLAPALSVLKQLHAVGHSVEMKFEPRRIAAVSNIDCHFEGILEGLLSDRKV
jgi:hypothetical protein